MVHDVLEQSLPRFWGNLVRRATGKLQMTQALLSEAGVPMDRRFTFFDQVPRAPESRYVYYSSESLGAICASRVGFSLHTKVWMRSRRRKANTAIRDNQPEKPSCPRDPLEFKNP